MNEPPKDAVVAIIQKMDRFLFVKRSDYKKSAAGYWCPVSGRVEKDETQKEALQREVKEEVGMSVRPVKRVCVVASHDNRYRLHFWTTEVVSGDASITSNEATDLRWVTLEQMKGLSPVFQEDIQVFEKFTSE